MSLKVSEQKKYVYSIFNMENTIFFFNKDPFKIPICCQSGLWNLSTIVISRIVFQDFILDFQSNIPELLLRFIQNI